MDFGDAPDPPYATLLSSNGARHQITGALELGSDVDAETDGKQNPDALGDDLDGAPDEDGVSFGALNRGNAAQVIVEASTIGILNAWIDFNADGDWDDLGEHILTDETVGAGLNTLTFAVPATANLGSTFARFRVSSAGGLTPSGQASDGEVEDYEVTITAPTPTPTPINTPTPGPTATPTPLPGSPCENTGLYSIAGIVTSDGQHGIAGVTLTLDGPSACIGATTTQSAGTYFFPRLGAGTYKVTPSKAGCTFSPPSANVNVTTLPRANFTATCSQ